MLRLIALMVYIIPACFRIVWDASSVDVMVILFLVYLRPRDPWRSLLPAASSHIFQWFMGWTYHIWASDLVNLPKSLSSVMVTLDMNFLPFPLVVFIAPIFWLLFSFSFHLFFIILCPYFSLQNYFKAKYRYTILISAQFNTPPKRIQSYYFIWPYFPSWCPGVNDLRERSNQS